MIIAVDKEREPVCESLRTSANAVNAKFRELPFREVGCIDLCWWRQHAPQVEGRMKEDHFLITRIARARPSGGPNGKAKPIQKANSIGRRATESTAPARRPRHRSHPVTTSSPQTPKNATSSGTVVRIPIRSNGPPPYVGNPRNVQTSPVLERCRIP